MGLFIAWDALSDIVHVALHESEASHIWLVPVVFSWLLAAQRKIGIASPRRNDHSIVPGSVAVLAGITLWWTGYRFQIQSFWQFGAVLLLAGTVVFVLGGRFLRQNLPAFGCLIFLVPVPARVRLLIAQPLERLAAWATQSIGEVLGLAVGRSGNQLSVNGVDVCVAEACNGMRLVFTLFLACYVAMFIRPYRPWVRCTVLAAAPVVAVIANVCRLVPTLWVYAHFSQATAETFHETAGAVMVLAAFSAVTAGCHLLHWIGIPILSNNVPLNPEKGAAGSVSPEPAFQNAAVVSVLAVAMLGAAVHRVMLPKPGAAAEYHQHIRAQALSVPANSPEWEGSDVPIPQTSLDALKTNVAISRRLRNRSTGQTVDLLILQSPDIRDLVPHYPPICYPGQGLLLARTVPVNLVWPGTRIAANRYTFVWHDFRRGEPTVVDNFMVLPTGQTQPDTAGMERRIGTDMRYFGSAQVQVVYHQTMSDDQRTAVTESVLRPYLPLLKLIESGKQQPAK